MPVKQGDSLDITRKAKIPAARCLRVFLFFAYALHFNIHCIIPAPFFLRHPLPYDYPCFCPFLPSSVSLIHQWLLLLLETDSSGWLPFQSSLHGHGTPWEWWEIGRFMMKVRKDVALKVGNPVCFICNRKLAKKLTKVRDTETSNKIWSTCAGHADLGSLYQSAAPALQTAAVPLWSDPKQPSTSCSHEADPGNGYLVVT